MTISDRIFEKMKEHSMSQKMFSEQTGILQSTISEWKKKGTNPTSDKIMKICQVLEVTPEWLLSGVEKSGKRGRESDIYVISKNSEIGNLIQEYNKMDEKLRARMQGYMEAILECSENKKAKKK